MNRYALIENGAVTNVILWDGNDGWTAPEGISAMELPADSQVGIGWEYENGEFTAPVTIQPSSS